VAVNDSSAELAEIKAVLAESRRIAGLIRRDVPDRKPVLFTLPMTLGSGLVWATTCEQCGQTVRMGPGSKAAMLRLIAAVGRICTPCRSREMAP
jgi:hypothetical protein